MKAILTTLFLLALIYTSRAQRYFTRSGTITFEAGTSMEDIDATNKSVTSVFDAASGQIEFSVLIKGFEFKRALMQQHFNENYIESDKYPKSLFKGKIANIDKVDLKKDGTYPVTIKGNLEIHGVQKEVETTGTIKVAGESITATSAFTVTMDDYKIKIPGLVKDKISKTANVKVACSYALLK